MNRPTVSLTMIVRDAAATIAGALGSVIGLVDEMVVVDTGSADDTVGLAKGLGARVVEIPWPESFAAARNVSLSEARGDWIFWLDADEWLDEGGRAAFASLVERLGDDRAVYFMTQVSPESGGGELVVAQPRLFHKGPGVAWKYRVHEQILPSCLDRGAFVVSTGVIIRHGGYTSASESSGKRARNEALLRLDLAENPDDPWVVYQFARGVQPDDPAAADLALTRLLGMVPGGHPRVRPAVVLRVLGRASHDGGEAVEGALRVYPNDTRLLSAAGRIAREAGRLGDAERVFLALLSRPPDDAEWLDSVDLSARGVEARRQLASLLHSAGRLAEAERYWRAALDERPADAALWLGLAATLSAQSRWAEADAALDRVTNFQPTTAGVSPLDGPLLRARSLLARHDFEAARVLLEGLTEGNPNAVWPALLLARALLEGGHELEEASRVLREVVGTLEAGSDARRYHDALRRQIDEIVE